MPSGDRQNGSGPRNALDRRKWLGALGMAGAAGLAGCSTGGGGTGTGTGTGTKTDDQVLSTSTPKETDTPVEKIPPVKGSWVGATSQDFSTLNPLYNTEAGAGAQIGYNLDGAYGFRPGQRLFPRWLNLTSEDKRVWTAKLRENLQWSDPYGKQTAEDWVYLIKKVHQTDWAATAASTSWYNSAGNPRTVEKTGKYEFKIKLENIDPFFHKKPIMWGAQCVPKKLIKPYVKNKDAQGMKKDKELLNLSYSGNLGAYNMTKWKRQKKVVHERNDNWYMRDAEGMRGDYELSKLWSEAPFFNKLETQIIKESSSRLAAFKKGTLDTVSVPPNKAKKIDGRDDAYINKTPSPYIDKIAYNMRKGGWKPFRSKKVRQGLGCAVNKKRVVKGVFRNYADVAYTYQPRWSRWYDDSRVKEFGTGDLYGKKPTRKRIKKGLSNGGYNYEYQGDKLINGNTGEQVTLSLFHSAGQPTERTLAQFIAQEFKKNAGIKVSIQGIPGAQFSQKYAQQDDPKKKTKWDKGAFNRGPRTVAESRKPWDMSIVYGFNTYPMTPTSSDVFFLKDGFINYYGYYPSFDIESLYETANTTTSDKKRQEALAKLFGKLSKDQPFGMLDMPSDTLAYHKGIKGPANEFFNGWNFGTWYDKKPE